MPSKSSKQSTVRENDRVMVYIDGSNLYHVLSQSCGRHDLQFDKFAIKLANGRDLKRIYYYNIRQESDSNPNIGAEQQKFLDSMYDTPYVEIRLGIWKQRGDIMVEKGVDVMLATDLVTHAYKDHYDTAIVVSGDADFYPALQAVKDVGKHVEVAAFDMNLSAESGRVADVVNKFTKSYFTGLWMTQAQARSRATSSSRPEVSDEAASPNGEDKAATKAATARRSGTRKTTAPAVKPRRTASPRTRKPASRKREAESLTATERNEETTTDKAVDRKIRRTPIRRRVGGASAGSTNGTSNARSTPKPPALRTSKAAEPAKKETSDAEPVGSPTRRRNWRGRLGLNSNDDE
jgi:uncharacterized LabA/DUF88 family protein